MEMRDSHCVTHSSLMALKEPRDEETGPKLQSITSSYFLGQVIHIFSRSVVAMAKTVLHTLFPDPPQGEPYSRVLSPEATSNGPDAKAKTAKKAKEKRWTS